MFGCIFFSGCSQGFGLIIGIYMTVMGVLCLLSLGTTNTNAGSEAKFLSTQDPLQAVTGPTTS